MWRFFHDNTEIKPFTYPQSQGEWVYECWGGGGGGKEGVKEVTTK